MKVETYKIPNDIVSNSFDFFSECFSIYLFFFSQFLPQKWEFVTDYSFYSKKKRIFFLLLKYYNFINISQIYIFITIYNKKKCTNQAKIMQISWH